MDPWADIGFEWDGVLRIFVTQKWQIGGVPDVQVGRLQSIAIFLINKAGFRSRSRSLPALAFFVGTEARIGEQSEPSENWQKVEAGGRIDKSQLELEQAQLTSY